MEKDDKIVETLMLVFMIAGIVIPTASLPHSPCPGDQRRCGRFDGGDGVWFPAPSTSGLNIRADPARPTLWFWYHSADSLFVNGKRRISRIPIIETTAQSMMLSRIVVSWAIHPKVMLPTAVAPCRVSM